MAQSRTALLSKASQLVMLLCCASPLVSVTGRGRKGAKEKRVCCPTTLRCKLQTTGMAQMETLQNLKDWGVK